MVPLALYIHIPFCRSKCSYCDFNSYVGHSLSQRSRYIAAIATEMDRQAPAAVGTVYFGGGTPTLLPLTDLAAILMSAKAAFEVAPDAEITVEANPGTLSADYLRGLRSMGFTRLSLGLQSFDETELDLLGRTHSPSSAVDAFHAARRAGFENISLDLIYGLPDQTEAVWQRTLERAVSLEPEHLSLYALSVENGTPLAESIETGRLSSPDPDRAASMYQSAQVTLASAGMIQYEISNWSRTSELRCRHNLTYWRNEAYLGIGAGAHSWRGGRRRANLADPMQYASRISSTEPAVTTEETIGTHLEMAETIILGLRLVSEGVSFARFFRRFNLDLREVYPKQIAETLDLGLLEVLPDRIRLTPRGCLLGNQVFLRFLPDDGQD